MKNKKVDTTLKIEIDVTQGLKAIDKLKKELAFIKRELKSIHKEAGTIMRKVS